MRKKEDIMNDMEWDGEISAIENIATRMHYQNEVLIDIRDTLVLMEKNQRR